MVAAKEWTKTDSKGTKIIVLTTCMYKLDRVKNSLQQSDKNYNHPKYCKQPNGIGKDPNKSYVWVLENLESWSKKKTKDNITCNGIDWWCFPKQKISDNLIEFTRTAPPANHGYCNKEKYSNK